jgi:hypothetical protein
MLQNQNTILTIFDIRNSSNQQDSTNRCSYHLFHLQVQPLNHVYYQIQTWLGNNLEPQEWGLILQNDILEPTTTLLPPAPEELCYRIFCKQERLWFELRM